MLYLSHVTLRNHNRSTALEQLVIDYWELKHVLLDPNPRLWFSNGSKHMVHIEVSKDVFKRSYI